MAAGESETALFGGAAVCAITPGVGALLSGGFQPRESTTVESDLTARALVLRSGETTVALVVCDLLALSAPILDTARARIAARSGIAADRVMISATHTHSGPYVSDRFGASPDEEYLDWVAAQIAECVAVAVSRLAPVTVAAGTATVSGVCFNRRYRMRDGTVMMNPGAGNPDAVSPAGPVDPTVTSLLVEALDGTPVALWANLSLHYVGTDDPTWISADYYGHFAAAAQRYLGEGAIAMLSNGASGDINNVDLDRAVPTSGSTRAQHVAVTVAGAAVSAAMMARRRSDATLDAVSIPFTADRYEVSAADVALAQQIADCPDPADAPAANFSFVTGSPIYARAVPNYAQGVLALRDMPRTSDNELMVIRIGDVALVGLPGEIFVEFGMQIKQRSPFAVTAVVGLCGASMGYMPTRRAFSEGGYETWRNASSWTAPGTGEAMVDAVCARMSELV